jgi:hypothetical protein
MSIKSGNILVAIAAIVLVGFYLIRITAGTGPLENAYAENLVAKTLKSETNRVEVIAPDGEVAHAPPSALQNVKAVDCPKLDSSIGSTPGRWGVGSRTYGGATFNCLFTADNSTGNRLFFSAYVHRTADPSVRSDTDGHSMVLLKSPETRQLMRDEQLQTRVFGEQEQAALWAELAGDDIYVPADKTQTSPMKKALDTHLNKLISQ